MPSATVARTFNASYTPPGSNPPVAVVVGGTGGIGAGFASALACGLRGELDVFVVGRNGAAARRVLDALPAAPARRREFVQCDARLMADVAHAATEIRSKTDRVNYLVMSQGIMTLQGRTETAEGIDEKMALHYYSRWKFAHELMPLLQRAKDAGEDAKVMSVLAPSYGGEMNMDDLGLRKTYSVTAAGLQAPTYNDSMVESLAQRHPGLSFIHAHPGFVHTRLAANSNSLALRMIAPITTPFSWVFGQSAEDCGARLAYGLFRAAPGASRLSEKGEDVGKTRLYTSAEANERLWQHSVKDTRSY